MRLNNLKPAAGSTTSRKRVGRGPGSGLVELLQEDIKEQNKDLVIPVRSVSRVDRCRFSVVLRNLVLRT